MKRLKSFAYWHIVVLVLLFACIAAIRIYVAYQSPLPDYEAYEQLRHVESIHKTGLPIFHDDLSFGGRNKIFSPLYQYILAFFGFFLPKIWLVKVIPNLFFAAIVFPSYAIIEFMTKNNWLSVLTSGMVALVPATFLIGINDASPLGLCMTLLCFTLFFFMKAKYTGKHIDSLLVVIAFLVVLHPISAIFLFGLALYVVFTQIYDIKTSGKDIELVLFTLFFTVWFSMVVYKKAFIAHGSRVIWQNIPAAELSKVFSQVTLLGIIAGLGVVTLLLGAYALFDSLMFAQRKPLFLLSGMILATLLLTWFRLLAFDVGLAFLGVLLALASGRSLELLLEYVGKMKIAHMAWVLVCFFGLLFLALSIPTIARADLLDTPSSAMILALDDITLPAESVVLCAPVEGDMFAYVLGVGSVLDDNYLLVPQVDERYEDAQKIYQSFFKIDALSLMQKYGVTHIFISDESALFSGVATPSFLVDNCFGLVSSAVDEDGVTVSLYERKCSLRGAAGG